MRAVLDRTLERLIGLRSPQPSLGLSGEFSGGLYYLLVVLYCSSLVADGNWFTRAAPARLATANRVLERRLPHCARSSLRMETCP